MAEPCRACALLRRTVADLESELAALRATSDEPAYAPAGGRNADKRTRFLERIDALETEVAAQAATIAGHEATIASQAATIAAQAATIAGHEATIAAQAATISRLEKKVAKLKADVRRLRDANGAQQEINRQLQDSNLQLQDSNRQLRDSNCQLRADFGQLQDSHRQLRADFGQLQDSHRQLQARELARTQKFILSQLVSDLFARATAAAYEGVPEDARDAYAGTETPDEIADMRWKDFKARGAAWADAFDAAWRAHGFARNSLAWHRLHAAVRAGRNPAAHPALVAAEVRAAIARAPKYRDVYAAAADALGL